jgi:hypothetical protein
VPCDSSSSPPHQLYAWSAVHSGVGLPLRTAPPPTRPQSYFLYRPTYRYKQSGEWPYMASCSNFPYLCCLHPEPTPYPDTPDPSRLDLPRPPAMSAPLDDPAPLATTARELLQPTFLIPSGLINSLPNPTPYIQLPHSFKTDNEYSIVQPDRPAKPWQKSSGAGAHETTNATIRRVTNDSPFEHRVGSGYGGGRIVGNFGSGFHPRLENRIWNSSERSCEPLFQIT